MPGKTTDKSEARKPKFETNSNDQKYKVLKAPVSDFDFRFSVARFVSNFELRISDFDSGAIGGLGAINFLEVVLLSI
jgi:hypothetical protein